MTRGLYSRLQKARGTLLLRRSANVALRSPLIRTKEDLLTEVMLGRSNEEMRLLRSVYTQVAGKSLDAVIASELSFNVLKSENLGHAGNISLSLYLFQFSTWLWSLTD